MQNVLLCRSSLFNFISSCNNFSICLMFPCIHLDILRSVWSDSVFQARCVIRALDQTQHVLAGFVTVLACCISVVIVTATPAAAGPASWAGRPGLLRSPIKPHRHPFTLLSRSLCPSSLLSPPIQSSTPPSLVNPWLPGHGAATASTTSVRFVPSH